jgi:hypothetical protein
MRFFLIVLATGLGWMIGLAACNNNAEPAAPSTKRVDSVVAAAPDTIKAISLDSGGKVDSKARVDSLKR